MKTFDFIWKFAVCMIALILFEGIATLGQAFNWSEYGILGWVFQLCLIIVCIKIATLDWEGE